MAEITSESLLQFVESKDFTISVCGGWGGGYDREITFDPQALIFSVYDHGEEIATTSSASEAADAYNAIQPREA